MKRMILTKHGERKKLAELMNVSERSVYNALNYKNKSKLMDKIRHIAKQRGAIIIND